MKKNLSKHQLEVMKILWDSQTPLIASDIAKRHSKLNLSTVQAALRVLIKLETVEVADIVYSGTVLTRAYCPTISRNEYFNQTYRDISEGLSGVSLIASLIDKETSLEELDRLEEIIKNKRQEIKEK